MKKGQEKPGRMIRVSNDNWFVDSPTRMNSIYLTTFSREFMNNVISREFVILCFLIFCAYFFTFFRFYVLVLFNITHFNLKTPF